jgi:hypothetical protein
MSIDAAVLLMASYRQVHSTFISGCGLCKLLHLALTLEEKRPGATGPPSRLIDLLEVHGSMSMDDGALLMAPN